jgi:hypothetical protein
LGRNTVSVVIVVGPDTRKEKRLGDFAEPSGHCSLLQVTSSDAYRLAIFAIRSTVRFE